MGLNENDFDVNDHYGTPERVWGPIIEYFGEIGLDPFWNPYSKVPSKCKWTNWGMPASWRSQFNQDNSDSFLRPWNGYGLVYVNGPFSRTAEYLRKCAKDGDEVIFLVKANVNARYWHKYVRPADLLLDFNGRLMFDRVDLPPEQAPFHCQLGYWGTRVDLFAKAFEKQGRLSVEYTRRGR